MIMTYELDRLKGDIITTFWINILRNSFPWIKTPAMKDISIWWEDRKLFFSIVDYDVPMGVIPIVCLHHHSLFIDVQYFFKENKHSERLSENDFKYYNTCVNKFMDKVPEKVIL